MSSQKINKSGWAVLEESTYESFPIFTLKKSRRVNPLTGTPIDFVRVEGLDWVNVLAFTEKNELVLVKQYRHGCEEYTLELPGGCVEKNETDPRLSGARELLEETGYEAESLSFLGALFPNPAMYNMQNYFYVAQKVKKVSSQRLDSGEDKQVVVMPFDEVIEQVKAGELMHGMAVAALGLYQMKRSDS